MTSVRGTRRRESLTYEVATTRRREPRSQPWETIGIYLFVLEAHPDGPQGQADKRASSWLIRFVARSLR